MIDSTIVRAHQHSAGAEKKAGPQKIGLSVGGKSTKIHAKVDALGLPLKLILSEGQKHDAPYAKALIDEPCDKLLADKGYDSDDIREHLAKNEIEAVIPSKSNRTKPVEHDKHTYKERNAVERFFAKIKHFRRVATRYEKLSVTYGAMVALAAAIAWMRV